MGMAFGGKSDWDGEENEDARGLEDQPEERQPATPTWELLWAERRTGRVRLPRNVRR